MLRLTTEIFIKKSIELWGDKYDYSLVDYVSAQSKVKIIYNEWIFEQSPENHLLGKLCEKRWTTERFIFDSKKIHGNKYDYSLVKFINMNTPITLILNGIKYQQAPCKHLMGREIEKDKILKTTKGFILDAKKIWGNKYDYSLVDYKGSHIYIKIIFNNIVYEQSPSAHLNKMCCERNVIKNKEDFIKKSVEKHGDKYDYSLVDYKGIKKKVIIIYKGEKFYQIPSNHLHQGLVEKKINKKTTTEFINESNNIHDFKYSYVNTKYINNHTKLFITCNIHGEFSQIPTSHLQGHGCPHCKESKGEKNISKFLNFHTISYDRQHRFNDCRGLKYPLPFDFYIPEKRVCIEFDGEQHFKPLSFFGGIESYERLKINDKIKSDYCEDNYINLIRIRYDQIDKINEILTTHLVS